MYFLQHFLVVFELSMNWVDNSIDYEWVSSVLKLLLEISQFADFTTHLIAKVITNVDGTDVSTNVYLSLVFTSDASISASTRIKIFPFSCACVYACVRFRCVKTEHYVCACACACACAYACAYACVASENQALDCTIPDRRSLVTSVCWASALLEELGLAAGESTKRKPDGSLRLYSNSTYINFCVR